MLGCRWIILFVRNSLDDCVVRLIWSYREVKGGDSSNREAGNTVHTIEIQNGYALRWMTVETDRKSCFVSSQEECVVEIV